MKMNLFLALPLDDVTEYHQSLVRTIPSIHIRKQMLENGEVIISKNYEKNETLVANPNSNKTLVRGYLYPELLKLNLDLGDAITQLDKEKIINFVQKYSIPSKSKKKLQVCFRKNQNNSDYKKGDKVNWLFLDYFSKPQDNNIDYFEFFKWNYSDFIKIHEAIKNEDYQKLNKYRETIDKFLEGNSLQYVYSKEKGVGIKWVSSTCLNRCYLELYSILLTKQKIKVCKYCGSEFTSSKENRLRCFECQDSVVFSRKYRLLYPEKTRKKAKERMRKNRAKEKLEKLRNQTTR